MNYTKTFLSFFLLGIVASSGCSGLGDSGGVTPPPPGNATLNVTMQAKPLTPPPNTNILSYSVTVGGVSLTPTTGSAINLPGPFTFDLTRLQSDSAFIGGVSVPAGTYTSMTVSLVSADVTYCTQTGGVAGCATGSVKTVTGGASAPIITFPGGGLVLSSSQKAGLSIYFDMGGTLTVASQVVSAVNLTKANLTTITLGSTHPSSLTSTELDYLEDITGSVTVSGNQVSITTANYGKITATADSSTFYSPNCTTLGLATTIACVQANQVASINAILNADGTIKLTVYDPISGANASNNDWIEGIVTATPTSATQFNIVANDASISTSGSLLAKPFPVSSPITVNLTTGASAAVFGVDTQGLNVPADSSNFQGTLPATVLLPGQTVAVHVTQFSATGGTPTGILVTANAVELRFTRIAGSPSGNGNTQTFALTSSSLPTFFGFTTAQQLVELTSGTPPTGNNTVYDGITGPTSITAGTTTSTRALFFGQFDSFPFVAAKVRQNQ